MTKVIAIAGFGPGIGSSVAEKFGKEGFKVALLSRTQSKLDAAATVLKSKGITAEGFAVDLNSASSIKKAFADVAAKLGPITVLHWNAYSAGAEAPVLSLTEEQLNSLGTLTFTGFVTAIQTVVKGFEGQEGAAILYTGADAPDEAVYIGEVVVAGPVKGTPFAAGIPPGTPVIEPAAIGERFYSLYAAADSVLSVITPV